MTGGNVLWITGLSASGKSTVARVIVRELRQAGMSALLLDGDDVREAIADPAIGHDERSRLANAWRIARLARLIAAQRMIVVAPTMSLFHVIHAWNRRHLPGYYEVLLETSVEVCIRRDPGGLYARAEAGEQDNVVGIDLPGEMPVAPHLRVANGGGLAEAESVARTILAAFLAWRRATASTTTAGTPRSGTAHG